MKRYLYSLSLLASFLLATSQELKATHAQGADIVVGHVTGLQYQVAVALYRDCSGITPFTSLTVTASSSCGNTSLVVNLVGVQTEVSPLCPSQLPNSTCSGGAQSQPGVEQWLYEGTITLPSPCNDWTFSITECSRNGSVSTLANPAAECLYVAATLDNLTAPVNSSPVFSTLPVPYVCVNQPYTYNHGAVDPDGDSLVYSLVDALDGAGNPVLYNAGFSGTNPMTSSPAVTINSLNGNILINPTAIEVAVFAVLVEEYRNGVLIGSTIRDIQITVLNCTNASTVIHPITNVSGGVLTGPSSIEVCPGTPLSFDIPGSDPNDGLGDSVYVDWNNGIAGAIFVPDADIDTVTGSFSWTPTLADVGFNSFTVNVSDNGCPILAAQILAVDIFVFDGTYAGPDQNYCTAESPKQIVPVGGSNFTWSVISGDAGSITCNGPACDTVVLNPTVTTVYEVTSNFTCNNVDTVVINSVPNFTLNTSPNSSICLGSDFGLQANPNPPGSYGAYSWLWGPAATLSDDTLVNPVATPTDTTTYDVTVTSAAGCTITDSVTISVANVTLSSDPVSTPTQSCQGDPVLLDAQVSTASSYTHSWESPLGTVLVTNDSLVTAPSVDTRYYSRTEAAGGVCVVIDSVDVQTASIFAGPDDCITAGDTTFLAPTYTGPPAPNDCNVYDITSVPFDTVDISGIATPLFPFAVNSELSNFEPIGFPFTFFCVQKDSFQVSENGWLSFTFGLDDDRSNDVIPSTNGVGDYIAFMHDDLDPLIVGANPRIEYATIGTTPNRQLILNFFDVPHRAFLDSTVSVQLKLFETTNRIEIHVVSIEEDGGFYTMGIEDSSETIAWAVPGRNSTNVNAANEAWRFTPQSGLLFYSWSPGDSLSDSTAANPAAFPTTPTNYIVSIDNGVCVMTDTVFVDVPPTCTLPIEGLTLEGNEAGRIGRLVWRTDSEENSDYFIVERSREDLVYTEIHRENAMGISRSESEYRFDDLQPFEGVNYYRVTGLDRNGTSTQSNVVALDFRTTESVLLGVYPNPSAGQVYFDLSLTEPGVTEITLTDISGRRLTSQSQAWEETGVHTQTLDLSGLADGIYLYQIHMKGRTFTGKLQIVK